MADMPMDALTLSILVGTSTASYGAATMSTNLETEILFLLESYPLAFLKGTPKPLKVGIRDDLVSRGLSKSQANAGLKAYCRRGVYRGCLVAGAERIDLDGNAAGVVTDAEAAQATVTPKRTAATPEKPPHK